MGQVSLTWKLAARSAAPCGSRGSSASLHFLSPLSPLSSLFLSPKSALPAILEELLRILTPVSHTENWREREGGGERMSSSSTTTTTSSETIIKDVPESDVSKILSFFNNVGVSETIPSAYSKKGFYSDLVHGLILKVDRVERGKVSCLISVKPVVTNFYGALHGGAVAAVAEILSIACARTVVGEDREMFLGEMSMSYLSASPSNVELIVDASVVRTGRNITVVAVEFRSKKTGKLVDTARATFYNTPTANL